MSEHEYENKVNQERIYAYIKIFSVTFLGYLILETYDTTPFKEKINEIFINRFNIKLL